MVNNRIIFLRHADTQKDPNIHASQWGLSETGVTQAEAVKDIPEMASVEIVYVSEEPKTLLTVAPLAKQLGLDPVPMASFNEVARGEKFLSKEEFELEKNKQLEDLDYPAFNGETGRNALARFASGVDEVASQNKGKTVLIVTHGTVLNLYFADILNAYGALSDRWARTAFCAYGILEDGRVVKDIV